MHVIVVGCGRVGAGLASSLTEEGHSVAIIDRRADAFRRLPEGFTGQMVQGIGFDRDRLLEAGVERAGALAAVTNGDNSNILIARVARETFGIERVVARIYDPRRAAIYQRLGVPTIGPVSWTTERVLRRLLDAGSTVEWVDPTAKLCLVERAITPRLAGQAVADVDALAFVNVVGISRLGVTSLPRPEQVLQDGDVLYLAVLADRLADLETQLLGPTPGGH